MNYFAIGFRRKAAAFWSGDEGASLIEYSILIGLITALVVAIIFAVALVVGVRWQNLNSALT